MRKQQQKTYATSNSAASRNGNYSVTLDFSKGSRGTVVVRQQPERTTFTQKDRKRDYKK